MTYYPIIIVLFLAILNWIAVDKKWKVVEYITKPGTMLALLWWMWQSVSLGGSMLWFTLGLVFCLAGDVFLMIPRNMFIFGLLTFLLGQISYVVGFNNLMPFKIFPGIIVIGILAGYVWWLYPKFVAGLKVKGESGLKIPVLIYSLVISLMVYSAMMTWTQSPVLPALSVSLGAVLFVISDSMMAWDRFVNPLTHGHLKVMIAYHLGQIGIIFGIMLNVTLK